MIWKFIGLCTFLFFIICTSIASAFYEHQKNGKEVVETDKHIFIDVSSPVKLTESTLSGTLVSAYSRDDQLLFSAGFPLTWNTLSANALGELHLFVRTPNMKTPFVSLPRTIEGLHTAYLVKSAEEIFLLDEVNNNYHRINVLPNGNVITDKIPSRVQEEQFKNIGYKYTLEKKETNKSLISACKNNAINKCDKIEVSPMSVVFAYGGNNTNTVVVTNKGEVLFHSKNGWCRGEKSGEVYRCNPHFSKFTDGRGWQIYSSIKTQDGTLLGEYPTGRFWRLGDGTLEPTSLSPYSENVHKNRELQSVSLFCGDIYAGFWPYGEVWRKSLESSTWEKSNRLFSHPKILIDGFIPYRLSMFLFGGRELSAFLGQRVTSMVNHKNSLFIVSGNYGRWDSKVSDPWFLSKQQIDEYGKIYVKSDSNCLTTYVDDKLSIRIEISSKKIQVNSHGRKISETRLHDFDVGKIDHFKIGYGVFGDLSDDNIKVKIYR